MTPLESFIFTTEGPWETAGLDVQFKLVGSTLAFQCSASESDWRYNFDFAVTPYKDMPTPWKAHHGFVTLYRSVRDLLLDRISKQPVTHVTGFSQGAALALLAYEDIRFNYPATVTGAVFGCPRVVWFPSDVIALRFYDLQRYTVRGDPVTAIPPFPYRHVGSDNQVGPWALPWWTHHRPEEYERSLK